jgi:16S rRNA (cytosine1407-C5)-methyltransferase
VLDLCAAPGSKTLQTACIMGDRGRIAAVEKIKGRFFKLKANLNQHNVQSVHTYLTDGARVWRKTPERFDRVLLDAPCSSESRIKAFDPQSYEHWRPGKIKEMARKQKALMHSAINCLKPGGTLVYSTCSFAPEENEAIVDFALRRFGDAIHVVPVELPVNRSQPGLLNWKNKAFDAQVKNAMRILPDGLMEGFFICRLEKRRSSLSQTL